jgi:DNA-binding response OmpR family regulator
MHGLAESWRRGFIHMLDPTILAVTHDEAFVELLRSHLRESVGAGARLVVAKTIDDGCSLLETARRRLVVVHWKREGSHYEQLDRLLWATSVQPRRIPIVVMAERYRTEQATMMFRMGVSEYISRTHHVAQIGRVFAAYIRPASQVVAIAETEATATATDAKSMTNRTAKRSERIAAAV